MAEKDVLSQEEIDALLESVDEIAEGAEAEQTGSADITGEPGAQFTDVKIINFTGQEKITRGQLPVLDKINDRAAKLFAAEVYQLTAKDFEIKQEPLLVMKHRDFMAELPNPSLMTVCKFKPLRGKGMIIFDSTFVYDLVDYYFGGSTQFFAQKDRTDFTATELRVMEAVTKKLINNLIAAWEPIMHLDVVRVSQETNPQLVNITEPDDTLIVARFSLNFGKESGSFYFILPYSMLEPIKQQLELGASRPDEEIDPNWIKSLREELMDVELTVMASTNETLSTLGKVFSWQAGDFVPLAMSETVSFDVEGTPSFTAILGSADDKRAVQIVKKISY